MKTSARKCMRLACAIASACCAFWNAAGAEVGGVSVAVRFVMPGGELQPLPGATVTVFDSRHAQMRQSVTDETGRAGWPDLPPGDALLQAEMPGFRTTRGKVSVASGAVVEAVLDLPIEEISTTITVRGDDQKEDTKDANLPEVIQEQLLRSAPLVNERFQDALPLTPGVVRGPDGLLSMNGARPSQSGLLVNSVSVKDPVTGQYAMELPIEAITGIKVYSNPYSAEFGKFTGAVTSIETRRGTNEWKYLITNFFPRLRVRDGKVCGVESFTPRAALAGPIWKDRLWVSQNFEYRSIFTEVPSLPEFQNETQMETFDSFTRVDFKIDENNRLEAVFSLYPQNLTYVNLDTFHPQETTPNFRQRGFFLAVNESAVLNLNSLLDSTFSVKEYNAHIWGNSPGTYTVSPEGWSGGFFDIQDRYSRRWEWSQTLTLDQLRWKGTHDPKMGYTASYVTFHASDLNREVRVVREDGTLSQRIDFVGGGSLKKNVAEFTAYFQDKWQIGAPLTLNLGVRLDWDNITHSVNAAPRFGFAVLPFPKDPRTVVRGGVGLFYDKVPLNGGVFTQYQESRVARYGSDGVTVIDGPVQYANVLKGGKYKNPRALMWNVEVDRELVKGVVARVGYQQRNQYDDLVLDATRVPSPQLVMSNRGKQLYRELLFGVKCDFRKNGHLSASYIRSKSRGNLNQYEYYLGNYHYPIFRPDEYGPLPYDAPNRLLVTGRVTAPWGIEIYPVMDYRNGFPFSVVDQEQDFVGPRNRGGRFPNFFSLDVQVMKRVTFKVFKRKIVARVGVKVFNITNHFNPRDVQNNLDSPSFGGFYNSVGRIFRGKFEFDF